MASSVSFPGMNRFFLFFFIAAVCSVCSRSQEEEAKADDTINVSSKCAAVLLASGTTLGAGVTYALTPAALCTAGFCAPGVAAGSFASWWQSTMPLVVKGSLFAKLQAIAAGGVTGMGSSVAGAAVGGVCRRNGPRISHGTCIQCKCIGGLDCHCDKGGIGGPVLFFCHMHRRN